MAITYIEVNTTKIGSSNEERNLHLNAANIVFASEHSSGTAISYHAGDNNLETYIVSEGINNIVADGEKHLIKLGAKRVMSDVYDTPKGILLNAGYIKEIRDKGNGSVVFYDHEFYRKYEIETVESRAVIAAVILNKMAGGGVSSVSINETFVVANQATRLASSAAQGDVAVQTDTQETYILQQAPATNTANWVKLLFPASVTSVNGQTGTVTIPLATTSDEGLVKIAAYPGGLRDNGLGALEVDPNVVAKLDATGKIPSQYLPTQSSGSGSATELIRLGAVKITHPLDSGTGRSIYSGTIEGTGTKFRYMPAKSMKIKRLFIHTTVLSVALSQTAGLIRIEQRYKVGGAGSLVQTNIETPLSPVNNATYPNPFAFASTAGVTGTASQIVYDIPVASPPTLEFLHSNYSLYIDIFGTDPSAGGLSPNDYVFEVYMEVEYV